MKSEDFLDLACLAYRGADRPERRARAMEMAKADPSLGTTTVFEAAAIGNVDAVRALLAKDVKAHSVVGGARDWPPILYLCYARIPQKDPLGTLEVLLQAGADPNARFIAWGSPFTAITGAIGHGEQGLERLPPHPVAHALVTRLLDAGADPNDAQALYNTMLSGDVAWLELLLSRGLIAEAPITWMKDGTRTLDFVLANAVDHGDAVRVALLLSHGADPNCANTYAKQPVHTQALLGGHDAVAQMLVDAGAFVTVLTAPQAFQRALAQGDLAEARARIDTQIAADSSHLSRAAERGELEVVRMLIDHGAAVDGTDAGGCTALHKAAWANRVEVVRFLLEHGANASVRERNHNATALDFARHNKSEETLEVLSCG